MENVRERVRSARLDGCRNIPDDRDELMRIIRNAVSIGHGTVVNEGTLERNHAFEPQGLTAGVVILAESHLNFGVCRINTHTYPEFCEVMVHVSTCGELADPDVMIDQLIAAFKPDTVERNGFDL